jgi:hypothetical protein
MPNTESFTAKYKPTFDPERDEWSLQVPSSAVTLKQDGSYEIRLPLYASRALAVGGNILRPKRKEYRDWLLAQQGGLRAACGQGARPDDQWNLDHQPPMASPESKFIDFAKATSNRVIHRGCDPAQLSRSSSR